jgi:hypothetical protein
VHRHRQGESIVLPKGLWDAARQEQEKRTLEDPLVLALEDILGDKDSGMFGRILAEDVWTLIGKPDASRRTQWDNVNLGKAMIKLGWERKRFRTGRADERAYFYIRGAPPHKDIKVFTMHGEKPLLRYAKEVPTDEERKF